ncbi:hypothetical protein D5085_01470 [Ectothiorhodospiraceae bacterium BW-2]|nr:hypothetical protein D5085_01470 [Ectothiorhodospiraceae bacterium BW-2]
MFPLAEVTPKKAWLNIIAAGEQSETMVDAVIERGIFGFERLVAETEFSEAITIGNTVLAPRLGASEAEVEPPDALIIVSTVEEIANIEQRTEKALKYAAISCLYLLVDNPAQFATVYAKLPESVQSVIPVYRKLSSDNLAIMTRPQEILYWSIKGMVELITKPGFICIDFADIRIIMEYIAVGVTCFGMAGGDNLATKTTQQIEQMIQAMEYDLTEAEGVAITLITPKEVGVQLFNEVGDIMTDWFRDEATWVIGALVDESMAADSLRVTMTVGHGGKGL